MKKENTRLVYRRVVRQLNKTVLKRPMSIEPRGGSIGPNSYTLLVKVIECLVGDFETVRYHTVVHDILGQLYEEHNIGPGFLYIFSALCGKLSSLKITDTVKRIPLLGHVSGLLFSLFTFQGELEQESYDTIVSALKCYYRELARNSGESGISVLNI